MTWIFFISIFVFFCAYTFCVYSDRFQLLFHLFSIFFIHFSNIFIFFVNKLNNTLNTLLFTNLKLVEGVFRLHQN